MSCRLRSCSCKVYTGGIFATTSPETNSCPLFGYFDRGSAASVAEFRELGHRVKSLPVREEGKWLASYPVPPGLSRRPESRAGRGASPYNSPR